MILQGNWSRSVLLVTKTDFKAEFGSYVEASTYAMVTNSPIPRRHDLIALGTSGNIQGSFNCFDLKTDSVVIRSILDVLPMPDIIVKKVNAWGMKSKKLNQKNQNEVSESQRRNF